MRRRDERTRWVPDFSSSLANRTIVSNACDNTAVTICSSSAKARFWSNVPSNSDARLAAQQSLCNNLQGVAPRIAGYPSTQPPPWHPSHVPSQLSIWTKMPFQRTETAGDFTFLRVRSNGKLPPSKIFTTLSSRLGSPIKPSSSK